jgi:hypothetical protein
LSQKVLSMKFMQRGAETKLRQTLAAEKTAEQQAQQWTASPSPPVTPARADGSAADAAAGAGSAAPSPFSPHFLTPSPFGANAAALSAATRRAPSVFVDEQEASSSAALGADGTATDTAAAAAPLPAFVPGRRSFGSFNPKVDALVSEALAATAASRQETKAQERAVRNSVSDESMADHYVGLRGKGISGGGGGGGGGGGAGGGKHKQQKPQQQGGGGGAGFTGKKHPRDAVAGAASTQQQGNKKPKGAHHVQAGAASQINIPSASSFKRPAK